jgi:hypothetical protein
MYRLRSRLHRADQAAECRYLALMRHPLAVLKPQAHPRVRVSLLCIDHSGRVDSGRSRDLDN